MKYNHNHGERGRFTTSDGSAELGTHEHGVSDRGVQIAGNKNQPRANDANVAGESHPSTEVNRPARTIRRHQHDAPANAVSRVAGDGHSFLAPQSADFPTVFATGRAEGLAGASANLGYWGRFYFQRDGDNFIHSYTDASNYAVGVYLAGAGYSLNATYMIANTFAFSMLSNAGSKAQSEWWGRGWKDATYKTGPFAVQQF